MSILIRCRGLRHCRSNRPRTDLLRSKTCYLQIQQSNILNKKTNKNKIKEAEETKRKEKKDKETYLLKFVGCLKRRYESGKLSWTPHTHGRLVWRLDLHCVLQAKNILEKRDKRKKKREGEKKTRKRENTR